MFGSGFVVWQLYDLIAIAGKENNGFDPNIQLVPGGSWAGSSAKPGTCPPPAAPAGPPGAPRPPTAPAPGIGSHTFSAGGWGTGTNNASAISAGPSAPPTRQDARVKMDFPELGAASKPTAPPAAQARPGMGSDRPGDGGALTNGSLPSSSVARWASRNDDTLKGSAGSQARKLDNDWAEDDDDGMDFSKPIVINRDDEIVRGSIATASDAPFDPKEEAKMLAMKKQEDLRRLQENIEAQARNHERQEIEKEKRQMEEREEERRREMEGRSRSLELRRQEQEEARARERAQLEARRAEELSRREEEMRKREEDVRKREEEREKQRQAEKELLQQQHQLMKESVEAAKERRQKEEEEKERERKQRAAEKLAELDRRKAEREAAEAAARAARLEAEKPPPQPPKPSQQVERAGMGSSARQNDPDQFRPRSSPWNQHLPEVDPEVERSQWAALRKDDRPRPNDDRPPVQPKPASDNRQGHNQPFYGGFSQGGSGYGGMADANSRGGQAGARQLYDPKRDRFVVDDRALNLREEMAEREAREAKLREKQSTRDAARKDVKEQKQLADKEAVQGPSKDELKKLAIEERRKKESSRRARESEEVAEEIQNADPQRSTGNKGKTLRPTAGQQELLANAGDVAKDAAGDDALTMPLTGHPTLDLLYCNGGTAPAHPWSGNFTTDVWGSGAKAAGSLMLKGDMKQAGSVMTSAGGTQFQNRSPEKGTDEGDRRKMQDANEVATKSADFLLDNDEHMHDKIEGMGAVTISGASFSTSSWQQSSVARGPWGNPTWDPSPFGAHIGFGAGLIPTIPTSHQVWDSSSGLAAQELASSQWASGSASANVPRAWSSQPQSSLQADTFLGTDGTTNLEKPVDPQRSSGHKGKAPRANASQQPSANEAKQHRESKPARGGKSGAQPQHKKESLQADVRGSVKTDDKGAPDEQTITTGVQQGGRGGSKGARGGHSAPNTARNKPARSQKGASTADGETLWDNKEVTDSKPARTSKIVLPQVSADIKQKAAALVKQREAAIE